MPAGAGDLYRSKTVCVATSKTSSAVPTPIDSAGGPPLRRTPHRRVIARPRSRIVATEVEPAAKAAFAHYFIMITFTSSKMESPSNPVARKICWRVAGFTQSFSTCSSCSVATRRRDRTAFLGPIDDTRTSRVLLRPEYCWGTYDTDRSDATRGGILD